MDGATPDEVAAGQAFYTKRSLAIYDLAILGYFCRVAWRCPARRLVELYNEHVSADHLDVGVGTGYFLDRCQFPAPAPRVGLMDLNPTCLDHAARRIARYEPEQYLANVLEPITIDAPKFDSVGMTFLLHCVPGDIRSKAIAFEHLKPLTNPGAVFFGATLLHDGVPRNWMARKVMDRNNARGIFHNTEDGLDGFRSALSEHLNDVKLNVVGCVGVFSGRA